MSDDPVLPDVPATPSEPVIDRLTKETVTLKSDASGCGYQGHEFGANYLDSVCIDGYLWDADSGDACGDGEWMYTIGGELACPHCNHAEWAAAAIEDCYDEGFQKRRECPHPDGSRFDHLGTAFEQAWMQGERDRAEYDKQDEAQKS